MAGAEKSQFASRQALILAHMMIEPISFPIARSPSPNFSEGSSIGPSLRNGVVDEHFA